MWATYNAVLGRERVFLAGLGLSTLASLACGLSFSQPVLIAARFVRASAGQRAPQSSWG